MQSSEIGPTGIGELKAYPIREMVASNNSAEALTTNDRKIAIIKRIEKVVEKGCVSNSFDSLSNPIY